MRKFRYFCTTRPKDRVNAHGNFYHGELIMDCSSTREEARKVKKNFFDGDVTILQFEAKPPYKFVKAVS